MIALLGPTGVGKTAIAVELARALGGEIVGCDSRQVYRDLQVGTAAPDCAELRGVRHHLLAVAGPGEPWSAQRYVELALEAIQQIRSRGAVPILTVGTGLYYEALLRGGLNVPATEPWARERALKMLHDSQACRRLMESCDPRCAEQIAPGDRARLQRWLEVYVQTGRSLREWQSVAGALFQGVQPDLEMLLIRERAELYARINDRVDTMVDQGLLDEFCRGLESGYDFVDPKVVGYTELLDWYRGAASLPEALDRIRMHSRRYAKRQLTWFRNRLQVPAVDITGLDAGDSAALVRWICQCCAEGYSA